MEGESEGNRKRNETKREGGKIWRKWIRKLTFFVSSEMSDTRG